MGNYLQMKTITTVLLLLFFLGSDLMATELEWVDEQIEAIKPPRKGIKITVMTNTFIFLEKNKKEKKADKKGVISSAQTAAIQKPILPLTLTIKESVKKKDYQPIAVLNKSAMIDNKWYKQGERVDSYTVTEIDKNIVRLKDGDKEIVLSTNIQTQALKFKNK